MPHTDEELEEATRRFEKWADAPPRSRMGADPRPARDW